MSHFFTFFYYWTLALLKDIPFWINSSFLWFLQCIYQHLDIMINWCKMYLSCNVENIFSNFRLTNGKFVQIDHTCTMYMYFNICSRSIKVVFNFEPICQLKLYISILERHDSTNIMPFKVSNFSSKPVFMSAMSNSLSHYGCSHYTIIYAIFLHRFHHKLLPKLHS